MFKRSIQFVFFLSAIIFCGCASSTTRNIATDGFVVEKSLEKARQSAVDAIIVFGFNVKIQTEFYVEGTRPHKIGLFVGSGGETVRVYLESLDPDKTKVRVETIKSALGIVGQRHWEEAIQSEMIKPGE